MKNFDQIYEEVYKEYNDELEKIKEPVKKRSNIRYIISFFILIIGGILTYILKPQIISIGLNENLPIEIAGIVAIIFAVAKREKEYTLAFKSNVISKFVKSYSENLEYFPENEFPEKIFNEAEFENYYRYYSEDYICGTLDGGYSIQMAEIHTKSESLGSGDSTIFYGLFAQVEHNKFIEQTIKLRRNSIIKISNRKEKIEMDSEEFETIYDVYSQDKIVTMQLLTADIMQMLIDFKRRYKLTPELTLKGNKLYIRFQTGDVFESNIMGETLDYNTLKKYYDIINFTLEITEKFLKNIKETEI